MNKIKLSIASILFLFQFYDVNAQWFVGGNTLSASNQKFGSLNSYDVNVITNGSPIFDFTTNGDIDYKNSIRGIMHLGRYSFVLPAPAGGNSRNTFVGITNNSLLQPGFRNSMFGYGAGTSLGLINLKDSANTFLGTNAGTLNYGTALQAMLFNTFVGYAASGNSNFPTQSNTFVGSFSGEQNVNNDNCFFGFKTGLVNKGAVNTFVGILAGLNNDTASLNTFLGGNAGRFNRAGYANVFTGVSSGASNISGSLNTAIGYATLSGNTSSSIGSSFQNTLLGAFAGSQMNASSNNVMLGFQAGTSAKNTQNNVLIGMQSGYSLAALSNTDNNNVFIGHQSGQAFQG
ncbi:MAG: hypothetical protein ORN56_06615, partial [Chitinophagales bacterium]|nr:hypothetical protein [Chitinophagales bacterium]